MDKHPQNPKTPKPLCQLLNEIIKLIAKFTNINETTKNLTLSQINSEYLECNSKHQKNEEAFQ
jgi:septum formation topological specificity factor MinE